jgi:serine/threonine-protein kinase
VPLVTTPASDRSATFSPDSRWFAYVSNVSGRDEVYVRRFESTSGTAEHLVSTEGGREPQWSRDGKELFYRVGRAMMTVPVDLGEEFVAGEPQKLFEGSWAVESGGLNPMYDVSPDGERFVMVRADEGWNRVRVVLGWQTELERLTTTGSR